MVVCLGCSRDLAAHYCCPTSQDATCNWSGSFLGHVSVPSHNLFLGALPHWLFHLVCVTIRSYVVLQLFNENVIFYQAKLFMFYNVQTIYWTLYLENGWEHGSWDVPLHMGSQVLSPKSQVWHGWLHGNTFWRWGLGLVLRIGLSKKLR